ncbi:MAG: hypothetical protein HC854_06145, partial [Flavobacterium sp.]|nr:hypothetical protein [Flavobacterium sp.]
VNFEIIDLQFDDLILHTIPQKIGVKKTKWLAYSLLVVFITLDFLNGNATISTIWMTVLVAFTIAIFTFFANANCNKYYTSFWVESIPVFWLMLLLLK